MNSSNEFVRLTILFEGSKFMLSPIASVQEPLATASPCQLLIAGITDVHATVQFLRKHAVFTVRETAVALSPVEDVRQPKAGPSDVAWGATRKAFRSGC